MSLSRGIRNGAEIREGHGGSLTGEADFNAVEDGARHRCACAVLGSEEGDLFG
jgi:hypothetical protein